MITLTIIANTVLQKFRQVDLLVVPNILCSYAIYLICIDFICIYKNNFTYTYKNITRQIFYNSNLIFAIVLCAIAFIKDRLTEVDYSKWLYFIGAIGILISEITLLCQSDLKIWQGQLVVFILSLAYVVIGLMIERKSFSILGVLGIIEYVVFLEFDIIKDNTALITSALIMTGLIILYSGVIYSKNADKFKRIIKSKLPEKIRKHLQQGRI